MIERTSAYIRELLKEDIKALQNIDASVKAFTHLLEIYMQMAATSNAAQKLRLSELASDSFYAAVIRYCKPFTNAVRNGVPIQYSIKRIQKNLPQESKLDRKLHDHLLELRNKLIGHDDHDVIEPKIMTATIEPQDAEGNPNGLVLMVIEATNKCIGHPLQVATIQQMLSHAKQVLQAITATFHSTAEEARQRAADYPNELRDNAVFSQDLGSFKSTVEGKETHYNPQLKDIPWFSLDDPFEGYNYLTSFVRVEFNDQTVTLPNGEVVEIRPSAQKQTT